VNDKAGNVTSMISEPFSIGHFKAQQTAYELNGPSGATMNYQSTAPFPFTESIVIRNLAGTVVRRLITSVSRAAGTYNDAFNARDDANQLLPDGPYFYTASVTAFGRTMNWDTSSQMRNDYANHNDLLGIQPYDPFNNKPLAFNYSFAAPSRITVGTNADSQDVQGNCAAPDDRFYCPADEMWQESGPQTFTWWGIDHTGSYRAIRGIAIVARTDRFPKNALVLFGSKPKLTNVRVTPPIFGPEVSQQSVEFDLAFTGHPVGVAIEFVNLSTKTVLRTVEVSEQSAGHAVIAWDGRADDGMRVSPGRYNVIVTVTDGIGNVVKSGILTEIQY
jgi:flagellar hook assembly protein FlgD